MNSNNSHNNNNNNNIVSSSLPLLSSSPSLRLPLPVLPLPVPCEDANDNHVFPALTFAKRLFGNLQASSSSSTSALLSSLPSSSTTSSLPSSSSSSSPFSPSSSASSGSPLSSWSLRLADAFVLAALGQGLGTAPGQGLGSNGNNSSDRELLTCLALLPPALRSAPVLPPPLIINNPTA